MARKKTCADDCPRPPKTHDQSLYVSDGLPQTGRVMVKDEDLCVHCGLCAERCPTGAWDMQKFDDPDCPTPWTRISIRKCETSTAA